MILTWFIPAIVTFTLCFIVEFILRKLIKSENKFWWTKENQTIIGWQNRILFVGVIVQLLWIGYMIGKL